VPKQAKQLSGVRPRGRVVHAMAAVGAALDDLTAVKYESAIAAKSGNDMENF
jgi:hypothetical protein